MKIVRDEQKNNIITSMPGRKGIGFEQAKYAILNKQITYDGPNDTALYTQQKMFIVNIDGYPYKVPYTNLGNNTIRLITVFPYRKFKG